tara:strand:- start:1097 stop:1372 length:276 start_codon:yes stop_codon:yes gene_type:complete
MKESQKGPRAKRLSTEWTQHLKTKEEKEGFEAYVRNSVGLLEILEKIVDKKLKKLETAKDEDYDKASWAHYQADRLGQIRAYNHIKETIQL